METREVPAIPQFRTNNDRIICEIQRFEEFLHFQFARGFAPCTELLDDFLKIMFELKRFYLTINEFDIVNRPHIVHINYVPMPLMFQPIEIQSPGAQANRVNNLEVLRKRTSEPDHETKKQKVDSVEPIEEVKEDEEENQEDLEKRGLIQKNKDCEAEASKVLRLDKLTTFNKLTSLTRRDLKTTTNSIRPESVKVKEVDQTADGTKKTARITPVTSVKKARGDADVKESEPNEAPYLVKRIYKTGQAEQLDNAGSHIKEIERNDTEVKDTEMNDGNDEENEDDDEEVLGEISEREASEFDSDEEGFDDADEYADELKLTNNLPEPGLPKIAQSPYDSLISSMQSLTAPSYYDLKSKESIDFFKFYKRFIKSNNLLDNSIIGKKLFNNLSNLESGLNYSVDQFNLVQDSISSFFILIGLPFVMYNQKLTDVSKEFNLKLTKNACCYYCSFCNQPICYIQQSMKNPKSNSIHFKIDAALISFDNTHICDERLLKIDGTKKLINYMHRKKVSHFETNGFVKYYLYLINFKTPNAEHVSRIIYRIYYQDKELKPTTKLGTLNDKTINEIAEFLLQSLRYNIHSNFNLLIDYLKSSNLNYNKLLTELKSRLITVIKKSLQFKYSSEYKLKFLNSSNPPFFVE